MAESKIKPFKRERATDSDGNSKLGSPKYDEIHYYTLPWPKSALEGIDGNASVKITLSYFVEPSPGANSPLQPARYQSFGLRFELKRADETEAQFRSRINALDDEGEDSESAADSRWLLGSKSIAAGSVHTDEWVGPAAELASRYMVAIRPVAGWWKYRAALNRYDSVARYALVISVSTEDQSVDLYSEIVTKVPVAVETEVALG